MEKLFAIIESGVVTNIAVADGAWPHVEQQAVEVAAGAVAIGDTYADGVFSHPAATPTITIPQSVTRFQARAALHLAGLLPQVEELMASPEADPIAKLAWADAQEFKRTSPTVLGMAQALGLTEQQVDDLFTAASGIQA